MIFFNCILIIFFRVHGSTVIENLKKEVERSTREQLDLESAILEDEPSQRPQQNQESVIADSNSDSQSIGAEIPTNQSNITSFENSQGIDDVVKVDEFPQGLNRSDDVNNSEIHSILIEENITEIVTNSSTLVNGTLPSHQIISTQSNNSNVTSLSQNITTLNVSQTICQNETIIEGIESEISSTDSILYNLTNSTVNQSLVDQGYVENFNSSTLIIEENQTITNYSTLENITQNLIQELVHDNNNPDISSQEVEILLETPPNSFISRFKSCSENFSEFQAKMKAKLTSNTRETPQTSSGSSSSSTPSELNQDVFRYLMNRIASLEQNTKMVELYLIQVSFLSSFVKILFDYF